MSQLVDKLADLVALRDRDARNERWLTCAQLQAGQLAPARDAGRSVLDDLPFLATYPLR